MDIEADGYRLPDLLSGTVNYAFVAMDFDSTHNSVYTDAIAPAVREAGLVPVRSDQVLSAGGVVAEEILQLIAECHLVVADVTGSNPNVVLEVGAALARGKDLVYLTQDAQVAFDIQHHRRIRYSATKAGLLEAKRKISMALKATINPEDALVTAMLWKGDVERPITVIHGSPSPSHLVTLTPSADAAYLRRLGASSSQTTGILRLANSYQRIARTQAMPTPEFRVANANGVAGPDYVDRASGNAILLGGPAGNAVCAELMDLLVATDTGCPVIARSPHGRFHVYRQGRQHPSDQAELLETKHTDLGVVIRMHSPWRAGAFVWCAAGVRSFGTEAAIRLLDTPSGLKDLAGRVSLDHPNIWALVHAVFDPKDARLIEYHVREAAEFDL